MQERSSGSGAARVVISERSSIREPETVSIVRTKSETVSTVQDSGERAPLNSNSWGPVTLSR